MKEGELPFFKRYNLQFWLLCLSSFLFFASFNMIIPELPSYLTKLGGGEYKGLIISLFTLTAMISRPFSGKLTDRIGRIPVMVFGAGVSIIIALLYPVTTSIVGFFILRLLHGFSTGFKPTGTVAYIADIVPDNRRGEAMGLSGVFGSIGMAAGPAIGGELVLRFSKDVMFYVSSGMAIMSVLILIGMKETLAKPQKFRWEFMQIHRNEIIDLKAIPPMVFLLFTVVSYGVVLTIIPDLTESLGFQNKGIFFSVFVAASIAVRVVAGRISDRFGREPVLVASSILIMPSMFMIGLATDQLMFFAGAVVFGIGSGINSPTVFAWTADLSDIRNRGKGMATMFIGLEAGIFAGAFISGWIYGNNLNNISMTFYFAAWMAGLALILLLGYMYHLRRRRLQEAVRQA